MKRYPIAMIPYANMAPYEALEPPKECYFVHCTPRASIEALKSGAVWAAAVPVGGLAPLKGVVAPLGMFGIAAYREVMSVIFFSDRPFDQFKSAQTVGLTGESASSVRLLYLLLGYQNGFDAMPSLAAPGTKANGELLIGDAALKWFHAFESHGAVKGYSHLTDLVAQWTQHHQLPFVFARWVVRMDAPGPVRQGMKQWLEDFSRQEPVLIEQSVEKTAKRLDLPPEFIRRYSHVIRRCLGADDQKGQDRFLEDWQHFGLGGNNHWFPSDVNPTPYRTSDHA